MRSRGYGILLACVLLTVSAVSHEAPTALPGNMQGKLKGGWQESSQMALSFAATKNRIKSRFEHENYRLKHEIEMGTRKDTCLMLWEKNGRQVIVMVWRMDVNQTGYSIGEIKDDNK